MVRAEKSGGVKHFLADRFPSLVSIAVYHKQSIRIRRFIDFLNREHPEVCISLLDVGARGGLNAIPIFKPLKRLKNRLIHGIEPDTKEAERLRKSDEYNHIFTDGVAWYDGEAVLHVRNPLDSSSIREYDKAFLSAFAVTVRDGSKHIAIPVKKLSSIIPTGMTYDIIKTDTEGCDYDVLASAEPIFLEKALCVVSETQRVSLFRGQYSDLALHAFLSEKRFVLLEASLQPDLISEDVCYVKEPQSVSDLPALMKYILIGLLFRKTLFCSYVLKVYERNYGEWKELDDVYRILGVTRDMLL